MTNIIEALNEAQKKQLKQNQEKLKDCTHCGAHDYEIVYTVNVNNMVCYPYYCKQCQMRSPIVEKKAIAIKIGFVGGN